MNAPGTNLFNPLGSNSVSLTDEVGNAILVKGTVANIPSGVPGYAVGCTFIATDTGANYYNTGTAASASFVVGGTIGAGSVLLASLATGIRPSHIVKFAGQPTTVGGAAAEAFTVAGAAATDLAFVQVVDNGTSNVTALQAVVTTNTLTVTFSGNPGSDTIINYQILRAAA